MGRGRRAGLDGLFIFKAGLPQMYMHIHQPGAHGQSPGIDHPGVGLVDVAPDDRYLSVLNQHIHNPADAPNRVNQPSLPYQQLHEITPFTLKPFQTAMQSTAKKGTGPPPSPPQIEPYRAAYIIP